MEQQPTPPAILASIAVARSLDASHFQHLIEALESGELSFSAGALSVQRLLHFSAAESRTVVMLLRHWQQWGKDMQTLTTTLQAIRATSVAVQAEAPSVRLVWTGPVSLPGAIRSTGGVLIDLIDHAQQEIVVVGYSLTRHASHIIEHLARAEERGVQVVLIIDRMDEETQLQVLRSCWPGNQNWPLLYTRKASESDPKSALHAKAVVVDARWLLATSANLSYHGLAGNIELGLLVEGQVAGDAVTLLKTLITEGICVQVDRETL